MLAGVYKLTNLVSAQQVGIAIFWQHDLEPLRQFVCAGRGPGGPEGRQ